MKAAQSTIPADRLAFYEALAATIPGLKRKGDKVPYTSVNGHMFSFLMDDGSLALRLPIEECDALRERFGTSPVEHYGVVKREYVRVPDHLLAQTPKVAPYFERSYAFVSGLKPNPATRKTKSTPKDEAKRSPAPNRQTSIKKRGRA